MYDYEWHSKSKAYKLLTKTGKFVASEVRPVFSEELDILNGKDVFNYDSSESNPLLWAKQSIYYYKGNEIGRVKKDDSGRYVIVANSDKKQKLDPVDIKVWLDVNSKIMEALVADTLKRIKEMYDKYKAKTDVCYIGFSGGKDSMVLLDLCHRVLPLNVPVIYSDTNMELPDSYDTWEGVKERYSQRPFKMVRSELSALENWESFGPPSQNLRWCCAVHKSTPAIIFLRELAKKSSARTLAYVGVRADESVRRSTYDDIGDGLKNGSQINAMPILNWGAHELWLYTFQRKLILNKAYRKGLPRVGCLLCPMSMERQVELIRRAYPEEISGFEQAIKNSITREFSSENDFEDFIYKDKGWHARQSGVTLKNVIEAPSFERKGKKYSFTFQPISKNSLIEWMKTLGAVTFASDDVGQLCTSKESVDFTFRENENGIIGVDLMSFSDRMDKATLKYVRTSISKSLGCIGCRACESECPTGALSFSNGVHVDLSKCIHCMRCHSTNDGCMRYFSRRYAGGTTMNISGINKYMTFGLKREWVDTLLNERENFRATSELGNRMIPSAVTWFREASLITESTAVTPTKLLEVAANYGTSDDSDSLWSMIWISLANKSPLVRWFVCSVPIDSKIAVDEVNELLHKSVASDSVRKGALQSLFNTLKCSPLGLGENPVAKLDLKGPRVVAVERVAKSIDPFALLFGLYLIGKIADRTSFTVSEMLSADFESPFISPLIAFGMSAEEFKAQCLGLSTIHPDFLSCSFTLGLDEIKIFPHEKTIDNVLGLILGE